MLLMYTLKNTLSIDAMDDLPEALQLNVTKQPFTGRVAVPNEPVRLFIEHRTVKDRATIRP